MTKPFCQSPWALMTIELIHTMGCCCQYFGQRPKWDPLKKFDVETYWNSEYFQRMRQQVRSKPPFGVGCDACLKFNSIKPDLYPEMPSDLTHKQIKNFNKFYHNYNAGNTVVNNYPLKYILQCGYLCNISCIMCAQKRDRIYNKTLLQEKIFDDLKDYLTYAIELVLIGGETLYLPNAIYFLNRISNDKELTNLTVSVVSNGTLIHKHFDLLKKINKLSLCISIDAIDESYETIRVGAKWNIVEKNLLAMKEHAVNQNLPWNFGIALTLMKKSFISLLKTIKWNIKNDIPVNQINIFTLLDYTVDDNIIEYPELLLTIPNWQEIFDESIEMLENKRWINPANQLRDIKKHIINNALQRCPQLLDPPYKYRNKIHKQAVSVITICHNAMPHIKDCIESIIGQDYPNIEYIIQDCGSTDGTIELVKEYVKKYSEKVRFSIEKEIGYAEALNRLIKGCTGEVVVICKPQDMLMPYAVRWAIESLEANKGVSVIYGDYVEIDERGNTTTLVKSEVAPYDYEKILYSEGMIPIHTAFFRREVIERCVEEWEQLPRGSEDFGIWVRVGVEGEVKYIPCLVAKQRIGNELGGSDIGTYREVYKRRREFLERFFKGVEIKKEEEGLRAKALGGLALMTAEMMMKCCGNLVEGFEYIKEARRELGGEYLLNEMSGRIQKMGYILLPLMRYGEELFNTKKYAEAYAVFDFLTTIDFWYPGIHYVRAVCLQMLGRSTDALLALKQEFALHPDFDVPNPEFFGLERG